MGKVEERWMTTTDGKRMLTWVIYPLSLIRLKIPPPCFIAREVRKSAVSQFWSYRWNLQIMVSNDYIIVAPNRRGLPDSVKNGTNKSVAITADSA